MDCGGYNKADTSATLNFGVIKMSEVKNAMFQFGTDNKIFEDTDLITLSEALSMFESNRGKFIQELERDNNPQMCVWINCKDNQSYGYSLYDWCADDFQVINDELWMRA